jgi:hypothetical protein
MMKDPAAASASCQVGDLGVLAPSQCGSHGGETLGVRIERGVYKRWDQRRTMPCICRCVLSSLDAFNSATKETAGERDDS